jgi:hypothetical protein
MPLAILLLALASPLSDAAERSWWRMRPEDRLVKTERGIEWFPAGLDREIHTHFEPMSIPAKPGSRVTVFGELTFRPDPNSGAPLDTMRIGLFEVAKPTRRDGEREMSAAAGVEFKLHPFTPRTKNGSVVKVRTFDDPPNRAFVLGALHWKAADKPYPGFGCEPNTVYPFVLEVERVAAGALDVRLLLNDAVVQQRVTDLEFKPNTFCIGRPGSSRWASLKVEGLDVRVVEANKN